MPPFADNFLSGAILSLALPAGALVAVGIWYTRTVRRMASRSPAAEQPAVTPPPAAADATPASGGESS